MCEKKAAPVVAGLLPNKSQNRARPGLTPSHPKEERRQNQTGHRDTHRHPPAPVPTKRHNQTKHRRGNYPQRQGQGEPAECRRGVVAQPINSLPQMNAGQRDHPLRRHVGSIRNNQGLLGGTVQTEQLPCAARAKENQHRRKQAAEVQVHCPNPFHFKKSGGRPPVRKSGRLAKRVVGRAVPSAPGPVADGWGRRPYPLSGLGEELGDGFGLDQLARLVEVIVHDRLGIDPEGVINRGQ